MKIGILACSVFEPELEKVLSDIENKKLFEDNIKVTYLHFGLHTNLDKLEKNRHPIIKSSIVMTNVFTSLSCE